MSAETRRKDILIRLQKSGKIKVKFLSKLYGVTEDLIRKDLKKLEELGRLERVYGGAIIKSKKGMKTNVEMRIAEHVEEKQLIAKKAASLINDQDVIFIDSSSLMTYLAKEIKKIDKYITVITNMIDVIHILGPCDNIRLIGIGGDYDENVRGYLGSYAIKQINDYTTDKAFLSCSGVNMTSLKLTEFDIESGMTKRIILDKTRESFLMLENRKFDAFGIYEFETLSQINHIITEGDLPKDKLELLADMDIEII